MRLGGWWRLWMAAAAVYGVAVATVTAMSWPGTPQIVHHPSFTYRMSAPALAVLNRPNPKSTAELERALVAADRAGATDEAKSIAREIQKRRAEPWTNDPIILEMPNGHEFQVAADTRKQDSDLVAKEYVRVLQAEVSGERWKSVMNAILIWLIPTLAVCVMGLLTRWVYSGFKSGKV